MKIYLRKLVTNCLFIFCLFLCSNHAFASNSKDISELGNFAQLSSSKSQAPGIGTETVILANVDQLVGLKVDSSHKKIIVQESGLYFIMANGRMGTKAVSLLGSANLFLMHNGTALPHSQTSYTSQNRIMTTNVISQRVLFLQKDDYISVGISSDSPNIGLVSSKSVMENIPSITFSMYKLDK